MPWNKVSPTDEKRFFIKDYVAGSFTIVELAARYGVPVAHFGDAMASVVAEHTLLLMLAALRRLIALDAAVRSGAWRTGEPVVHELRGSALG